jgi:hypothetical protein
VRRINETGESRGRAAAGAAAVMTHLRTGAATMRAHAQAIVLRFNKHVFLCALLNIAQYGQRGGLGASMYSILVTSDRTMVEVIQRVSRALYCTYIVLLY